MPQPNPSCPERTYARTYNTQPQKTKQKPPAPSSPIKTTRYRCKKHKQTTALGYTALFVASFGDELIMPLLSFQAGKYAQTLKRGLSALT